MFNSGLAFYLVYGPGHESRTAGSIGFLLSMAVSIYRTTGLSPLLTLD
jgi:hypothetical protein